MTFPSEERISFNFACITAQQSESLYIGFCSSVFHRFYFNMSCLYQHSNTVEEIGAPGLAELVQPLFL